MKKKSLLKRIKKIGFQEDEVAVPFEIFFDGNNVLGSIMANVEPEIHPQELYRFLNNLLKDNKVQSIYVRICDIDEEWPYSDSIYVITSSMNEKEIGAAFKYFKPDEVSKGFMYEAPKGIEEKYEIENVYTLWWD